MYPSDHFGLVCTLKIGNDEKFEQKWVRDQISQNVYKKFISDEKTTGFRTIHQIIGMRVGILGFVVIGIAAGIWSKM